MGWGLGQDGQFWLEPLNCDANTVKEDVTLLLSGPAASEGSLPLHVVPREEGEMMCPAGAGFRPQLRPPETAYEVLAHLI